MTMVMRYATRVPGDFTNGVSTSLKLLWLCLPGSHAPAWEPWFEMLDCLLHWYCCAQNSTGRRSAQEVRSHAGAWERGWLLIRVGVPCSSHAGAWERGKVQPPVG